MKIAIISFGNLRDMKGVMNFVHEKARLIGLRNREQISIDVFLLRQIPSWLFRNLILRKEISLLEEKGQLVESEVFDGITYHYIYYKYGLFDNFFYTKRAGIPMGEKALKNVIANFESYDVIASHGVISHYVASRVKAIYHKPFVATWHGSDINVYPKRNRNQFMMVKRIIECANMNFFVSKALLKSSDKITAKGRKEVLYTGPSHSFYEYELSQRKRLHNELGNGKKYVIGYVGNLLPIKNVMELPNIFQEVVKLLDPQDVQFLIVGNGSEEAGVRREMITNNIDVKWLGKVDPNMVPDIMNALDVLVLPSLNEGLPLVVLEARKCGAYVVGSDRGGIPEAIGDIRNCFSLGDNFSSQMAKRIHQLLTSGVPPAPLPNDFSWDKAIEKEISVYKRLTDYHE